MYKQIVILVASVMAAVAAPALTQGELPVESYGEQQQFFREKRSSFPGTYYSAPPCGAAPIHISPSYLAPVHHAAYAPQYNQLHHYSYGLPAVPQIPHYRDADENEMMSFSDDHFAPEMQEQMMSESMLEEHIPMARYAYGAPAVAAGHYGGAAVAGVNPAAAALGSSGPAIGVFPNANVGGCSVPLLLSCSPNIRPGHIVKTQPYYGAAANSYRVVDPHQTHEERHEQPPPAHDDAHTQLPLHQ